LGYARDRTGVLWGDGMDDLAAANQEYQRALSDLVAAHERVRKHGGDARYYDRFISAKLRVWLAREKMRQLQAEQGGTK